MVNNVKLDVLTFFKDKNGNIHYCKKCENCKRKCKQSFRIEAINCKQYKQKD